MKDCKWRERKNLHHQERFEDTVDSLIFTTLPSSRVGRNGHS